MIGAFLKRLRDFGVFTNLAAYRAFTTAIDTRVTAFRHAFGADSEAVIWVVPQLVQQPLLMLIVRIGSVFEMSHEVLMIVSCAKCTKTRVFMERLTITIFFKMVHLYKPHILYIWFIHCHTGCLPRQYLILPRKW